MNEHMSSNVAPLDTANPLTISDNLLPMRLVCLFLTTKPTHFITFSFTSLESQKNKTSEEFCNRFIFIIPTQSRLASPAVPPVRGLWTLSWDTTSQMVPSVWGVRVVCEIF